MAAAPSSLLLAAVCVCAFHEFLAPTRHPSLCWFHFISPQSPCFTTAPSSSRATLGFVLVLPTAARLDLIHHSYWRALMLCEPGAWSKRGHCQTRTIAFLLWGDGSLLAFMNAISEDESYDSSLRSSSSLSIVKFVRVTSTRL